MGSWRSENSGLAAAGGVHLKHGGKEEGRVRSGMRDCGWAMCNRLCQCTAAAHAAACAKQASVFQGLDKCIER
jgi:hypothetical protein